MSHRLEYRERFAAPLQAVAVSLEQLLMASTAPARLREAMRYSLLAPGKRVRAVLTLLCCQLCGRIWDWALPAAAAVEMVHAYSLIHDDLPAMDDADLRRGQPSCHRQFDEATAILAGDGLLTLAFEVLARHVRPEEVAVRCVAELAGAAGTAGMVGGQVDDLYPPPPEHASLTHLESIHRRKTGALLRAAARMGALIGLHRSPEGDNAAIQLQAITDYSTQLGLAFQIADDLLDVSGSSADMGKSTRQDAARGKLTYPGLLGIEQARQHLWQAYDKGLAALQPFGTNSAPLADLLQYVVDRQQ